MRRIPVDTTRIEFIGTGKVAERSEYIELSDGSRKRSGNQAREQLAEGGQGAPLWVIDVLVDDPDADRAEVASVKIASYEVPVTEKLKPVRFRGLTAMPYVMQGTNRVALSFTAEGIETGVHQSKPQAA